MMIVLAVVFSLPPSLLVQMLVAVVLPLLVGLVTTRVTSASKKAILLALMSFVTSVANELLASLNNGSDFDLGTSLILFGGTFLVSVGTYFGIWKPTGAAGRAQEAFSDSPRRDAKGRFLPKED